MTCKPNHCNFIVGKSQRVILSNRVFYCKKQLNLLVYYEVYIRGNQYLLELVKEESMYVKKDSYIFSSKKLKI